MIKYFDSSDLAWKGKSMVKEDFVNYYIKQNNIQKDEFTLIFVDDKLGLLKTSKNLAKKGFSTIGFWMNRFDYPKYSKKFYDYEIDSMEKVEQFIKKHGKKKFIVFTDFDNTLCKANYESTKRNASEKTFWDKVPKNLFTTMFAMIISPFVHMMLIIDLFYPADIPLKDSLGFKKFAEKNSMDIIVISYRSKYIQKKYF